MRDSRARTPGLSSVYAPSYFKISVYGMFIIGEVTTIKEFKCAGERRHHARHWEHTRSSSRDTSPIQKTAMVGLAASIFCVGKMPMPECLYTGGCHDSLCRETGTEYVLSSPFPAFVIHGMLK